MKHHRGKRKNFFTALCAVIIGCAGCTGGFRALTSQSSSLANEMHFAVKYDSKALSRISSSLHDFEIRPGESMTIRLDLIGFESSPEIGWYNGNEKVAENITV